MRTVSNTAEFKACFYPNGLQICPIICKHGLTIEDASFVTSFCYPVLLGKNTKIMNLIQVESLRHVEFSEGSTLNGLYSLKRFDGIHLKDNCILTHLSSIDSLAGLTIELNCQLHGLINLKSFDNFQLKENTLLTQLISLESVNQYVPAGVVLKDVPSLGFIEHEIHPTATLYGWSPI